MIGVLAAGCLCPLGETPEAVRAALAASSTALSARPHLLILGDARAAAVPGPELGPFMRRKKDIKMLPRAAMLALPAAARAMLAFQGDPEELGLIVAVGREPPDCDEAEASLVAMAGDSAPDGAGAGTPLSLERLAGAGRALYPPLLPLKTLPNMILAHVSIAHGICGENATFAGGAEAGRQAWQEAIRLAGAQGAGPVLLGAAFSGVDLASARDRLRLGLPDAPGEAAIFALIGEIGPDGAGGRPFPPEERRAALEAAWVAGCGDCGPVNGLAPLLWA